MNNSGAFILGADGFWYAPDIGPQEVLDYTLDCTALLGIDTIGTVTWSCSKQNAVQSSTNTSTTATVWISGAALGVSAELVMALITTAGDRSIQRSFKIQVAASS